MQEKLLPEIKKRGIRGKVVSISRLIQLEKEINDRRQKGIFNEELYERYLSGFKFEPPENFPETKSIIITAYPQPQFRINFNWNGKKYPTILPPTYLYFSDEFVREKISEILAPQGYRIVRATLPLKLLAVNSGLGFYGKNNICYIPGLGSFHRLAAFFSDFPCSEDYWTEKSIMESCHKCEICRRSCPTGAISSDRFLLLADRCLTFLNEGPRNFPSWVEPDWHNCLVGCLLCQRVCIQNKAMINQIVDKANFFESEVESILADVSYELLPFETRKKLSQLDLVEYYSILSRNLRFLFDSKIYKKEKTR